MESWIVLVQQESAALRMRPIQHPCRQEVVALIGRNVANTRSTQVIHSFTRDPANKLVWSEPVKQGRGVHGLLDALFAANQRFARLV